MSQHPSLRVGGKIRKIRNVMKRYERIDVLRNLKSRGDVDLAKIVLAEHRFRILKKDREFLNETENSCFVHCIPFMPAANMLHFNTLRKAAGCFHCNR